MRIAEEKGSLKPEVMNQDGIGIVFACEVKNGEKEKALYWLGVIEQNQLEVTTSRQKGKNLLNFKFGNPSDGGGIQQVAKEVVIQQM